MVRRLLFWSLLPLLVSAMSALAQQHQVPVLAVADFTGDNPSLCQAVTETVLTDLAKSRRLTLVERAQLRQAVSELRLQRSGLTEASEMARAGRVIGATHVVVGSVSVNEGRMILNARVLDVRTGALFAGAAENTEGWSDELFALAHDLANRLHHRLTGEPLPGFAEPAPARSEPTAIVVVDTRAPSPHPAPDWTNLPESAAIASVLGKGWMRLFADGSFRPYETVSERYFYETVRRFARRYSLHDAHLFPKDEGISAVNRLKAVRVAEALSGAPCSYFLEIPDWARTWLSAGAHKPLSRAQFAELLCLLEAQVQRAITPATSEPSVSAAGHR